MNNMVYEYKGDMYCDLYPYKPIDRLIDALIDDGLLVHDEAFDRYLSPDGHTIDNSIFKESIIDYFYRLGDIDTVVYRYPESEVVFEDMYGREIDRITEKVIDPD